MERRHDIDSLRVFATYLLFVFHVAMVFNPAPFYHIRNDELSMVFLVVCGFISLWHMPLFFLLAGWSLHASLTTRGTGAFLRERLFKLWVPLVMACVVLMPPIKYLELRSGLDAQHTGLSVTPQLQDGFREIISSGLPAMAPFAESFTAFLPTFFTDPARFTWAHMWFVAYLLTFTVLYLPCFSWLTRARLRIRPTSALWVYLPIVPLALVQLLLRERWPGIQNLYDDWANVAYYSTYLVAGFLLARLPSLEQAAHRETTRAAVIGSGTVVVLLLGVLGVFQSAPVMLVGSAVAGWCFVLTILGWGRRRLCVTNARHRYLVESAFPVYIMHQSAIVLPGFLLVQLPLGIAAKFALLLTVAVASTLAAYHFVVRRNRLLRFLFGMKVDASAPLGVARATAAMAAAALALTPIAAAAGSLEGLWHADRGSATWIRIGAERELCRAES